MIIVQTPLRISFFGGGTDFPSFYLNEGGCALSTAIDKYIFVSIKKRFDDKLRIGYTQTEIVDNIDQIHHELIREALRITNIQKGVEITTMGDIPAGSGLGSSGTVTVGTLNAMYSYLNEMIPKCEIARLACEIEIDILGKPIGVQDQYIAAFGGLCFLEFSKDGEIICNKVDLSDSQKRHLSDSLLLFYTGITRKSESILEEQSSKINTQLPVLRAMKDIAYQALNELKCGNIDNLGYLMHESWNLKKQLASRISNQKIDAWYEAARAAGALGGKITGAGGGGFLLLYCPFEKRGAVRAALNHLREVPVGLETDGTKVIFNYRR